MLVDILEMNEQAYKDLIDLAFEICSSFILVERDQLQFSENAKNIRALLEPYLLEVKTQDEWPGTRLIGHYAKVYYYKTTDEAKHILMTHSKDFNSWLAPILPEDLCCIKEDGTEWLVSVAHEDDCWISNVSLGELEIIKKIEGMKFNTKS